MNPRIIIGMTGASGVIYGKRLVEVLADTKYHVHLTLSSACQVALHEELEIEIDRDAFRLEDLLGRAAPNIEYHHIADIASSICSGSYITQGMAVVPCSMGTLAAISMGLSNNLIERAADVCMKQRRPLLVMPRETPLSTLHLENMLKLSQLGACVMPAMPGYYHRPESVQDQVDFMVSKVLDFFGIPNELIQRWRGG